VSAYHDPLPLFSYRAPKDEPPRYRRGQTTSKLAADELVRSGSMAEQRALVLGIVKAAPGHTALEYDKLYLQRDRCAGRRLSELERLGVVRKGDARRCEVGQRAAVTWWPTESAK
jgi:hypothetical protein